MNPQPYEIYLAKIQFRNCSDPRPCVILEVLPNNKVKIVLLSSNRDHYNHSQDFWIDKSHPDFPETGLPRSSCVFGSPIEDIEISDLIKKFGKLEGILLEDFVDWIV